MFSGNSLNTNSTTTTTTSSTTGPRVTSRIYIIQTSSDIETHLKRTRIVFYIISRHLHSSHDLHFWRGCLYGSGHWHFYLFVMCMLLWRLSIQTVQQTKANSAGYSRPKTSETCLKRFRRRFYIIFAHLAQSVERKTFNLVVVGSTPTVGTSTCSTTSLLFHFLISPGGQDTPLSPERLGFESRMRNQAL